MRADRLVAIREFVFHDSLLGSPPGGCDRRLLAAARACWPRTLDPLHVVCVVTFLRHAVAVHSCIV